MQIAQYFKRVDTVTPAALKDFLGTHAPESTTSWMSAAPPNTREGSCPGRG